MRRLVYSLFLDARSSCVCDTGYATSSYTGASRSTSSSNPSHDCYYCAAGYTNTGGTGIQGYNNVVCTPIDFCTKKTPTVEDGTAIDVAPGGRCNKIEI